MTSADIRQSFLDFFKSKQHTIVPSASLMPTAPNLLFTNAGMNQFVPYFLGDQTAPWKRVADTQKCIRAGGKHNDLEDVGYDTYHHTLFEMLGNWSFGDYFKKESLTWGWELLTKVWHIPPRRLFATVYAPDKTKGDPSEFDQEAYDIWAGLFTDAGLDPKVHIVNGNRKDNFWMMGDTGPCGPCSEVHFNLLPTDDEQAGRALVNASSPRCIEIWNHVFIQYNASADGTFAPLAAKYVDTGLGFERVAGIHASSKGFTDFSAEPSNYSASLFTPIFAKIAELSGETYRGSVPTKRVNLSVREGIDVAFRVLADHARCVACAIADGILPGNEGRNYVIRRILRRGVLYGKKLDLGPGFFEQLVDPVVQSLGSVFPELKVQHKTIRRVIRAEEESFGRTLEKGMQLFADYADLGGVNEQVFPGQVAFTLYDTYGFPLDMTQLLAAEHGLTVDVEGFESEMSKQRERGRSAQKKEVVVGTTESDVKADATVFVGYELGPATAVHARLLEVIATPKEKFLIFDRTPFYAEMGGQVGDAGHALINHQKFDILDCVKDKAGRHLHKVTGDTPVKVGSEATLHVDYARRRAISRHHSATHLLQWALRKVLGTHVRQSGTHKTPSRLRFDFSHFEALTSAQLLEVEQLVNAKVIDNAAVTSFEIEYASKPDDVLAFFGDKYGKYVRVVDIGGYSKELCGGTHVTTTGEIGTIKITAEMAIAAGTRRIEAVAGQPALDFIAQREAALAAVSAHLSAGPVDVAHKLEAVLAHQKELEKQLKAIQQKESAGLAKKLYDGAVENNGLKFVRVLVNQVSSMDSLKDLSGALSSQGVDVIHLFARTNNETIANVSSCSQTAIVQGWKANLLVSEASKLLGGKGGGKSDFAMGGGKDDSKLTEALQIKP